MTDTSGTHGEMVERVARALAAADLGDTAAFDTLVDASRAYYRDQARAAIAALAPELNQADLTKRAFGLTVQNAKKAGKKDIPVEELEGVLAEPFRVVMK